MALARTYSMALAGVRGHVVEVEADIENGLVALLLVGLPDTALREARDRIRSAIINSHHAWPQRRITVGLSPASLPKRGSGFDAAIAVAILSADGSVPKDRLAGSGRCRVSCRAPQRPRPPGSNGLSCPWRMQPRRHWCRGCRSSPRRAWARSSTGCGAGRRPERIRWSGLSTPGLH